MRNNIQPNREEDAKKLAREIFANLSQFITYCNEFLTESDLDREKNYNKWVNIIFDWKGTPDDLIKSYHTIIDMYFYWTEVAIIEERYEDAIIIKKAISYEKENYIRLGKYLFNKNLEEQINKIK
jgi:hypothetical protein